MTSLGWIAESSVLPKKRKEIEGIGTSSLIDLKTIVYTKEGENVFSKHPHALPASKRLKTSLKNKGVDDRSRRDLEEEQAEQDVDTHLKLKTEIYEKIARGDFDGDNEKYLVDFELKSFEQGETLYNNGDQSDHDNNNNRTEKPKRKSVLSGYISSDEESDEYEENRKKKWIIFGKSQQLQLKCIQKIWIENRNEDNGNKIKKVK